ncbi:MAG: extracellular solute-binding protein [Clostridiales bacterium]|nr:extracellular solute-binding protein [Clostridiales bacterium]
MRKICKRLCALTLTAVMAAGSLALSGCDTSLDKKFGLTPKDPVSLDLWHYYNGPQKESLDRLVTEFNETVGMEKGIVVTASSQGNVNDLMNKVLDSANKKVGAEPIPDIFAAYADTAYAIDQIGLAADLDPYFTKEELDRYLAGYLEEGRFDAENHLKIFPVAKSTEVMMLNKTDWDKFAAATGTELSQLSTMEGLIEASRKYYEWTDSLTDAPDDGKALFGRDAMANYMVVGAKQLGQEIFSVSGGEMTVGADKDTIRRLWDCYYVPFVNGYFGAYGKFRSDDAKTGALLACVGSTSSATYFPQRVYTNDDDGYPIEVLVIEPPCFEGGEKVAVQQGAGMVVTKSDEKTEYAAAVFLKWFTEAQRNMKFVVETGYMPVEKAANDVSLVESALQDVDASACLQDTLKVGVGMTQTHQMYTTKAFRGGAAARAVLENAMNDQAKADAAAVQALVDGGQTRKDAAAQYTTDQHFEEWYQDFLQKIADAVKTAA